MNRVGDSKALTEWMELARVLGAQLFELWERPTGGSKRRVFGLEADCSDEASDLYERIERRRQLQDAATSFVVRACGEDGEPLAQVFITSTPPGAVLAVAHHEGPNGVSPGSGVAAQAFGAMPLTMPQMMQAALSSLQRGNEQQRKTTASLAQAHVSRFDSYVRSCERSVEDMQRRSEKLTRMNGELRARVAASEAALKTAREEERHAEPSRTKLLAPAKNASDEGGQTLTGEVRSLASALNNAFARTLAAPADEREALFRTLDLERTFGFFQLYCDWVDDKLHDAAPAAVVAAALSWKPKRSR